jgi:hypothetical protein
MNPAPDDSTLTLLPYHRDQLLAQKIDPDVIDERGYASAQRRRDLKRLQFSDRQSAWAPGLLLPVHPPDGRTGLIVLRPDHPPLDEHGKPLKYQLPSKARPRLDVPPRCRPLLANPAIDLYLTEGQKKADALASRGLCAVALLGVWMLKARNDFGAPVLLADFDLIAWKGRTVFVVYDSDVLRKAQVHDALRRMLAHLERMGATVRPIYLPENGQGGKVGVDDYLLDHTVEELRALPAAPPPIPAPVVTLLDEPPLRLARPLAIVDGRAYAATWLWTQTTTTTTVDKDGQIQVLDPPRIDRSRELFIVRDDGRLYGPGADRSLVALQQEDGIEWADLDTDAVLDTQCWRTRAVLRYRDGSRPEAASVFRRLVVLFDYFMAFERSVADQTGMCELSAVLSLMTWLQGAFDVLPYPWATGDKGSGKTKWGNLWSLTSYLGDVIGVGSSFAALRDHAALGGTLMVDDAEALVDPKDGDPIVRSLLLSGNRRGTYVTLKESDGKLWRTRRVHAFAPRGFTAIRLPDEVLGSRSITLPLVRSVDHVRQRREPTRTESWPTDRASLLDDLWALGLSLLVEAQGVWKELDDDGTTTDGRMYDCWRAPLAVARLMGRHGVKDLEERIRAVLKRYLEEREDAYENDRMLILVSALLDLVPKHDAMTGGDAYDTTIGREYHFTASNVPPCLKAAADEDAETDWATPSRIGRLLASLRIRRAQRTGKSRGWLLTRAEVVSLAKSYGVDPESRDRSTAATGRTGQSDSDNDLDDDSDNDPDDPSGAKRRFSAVRTPTLSYSSVTSVTSCHGVTPGDEVSAPGSVPQTGVGPSANGRSASGTTPSTATVSLPSPPASVLDDVLPWDTPEDEEDGVTDPDLFDGPWADDLPYEYITEPDRLDAILTTLLAADAVGLDCETYGTGNKEALNFALGTIRLVQLATTDGCWILDLAHLPSEAVGVLVDRLFREARRLVAHNARFDVSFLCWTFGLDPPDPGRVFCTLIAARVLDGGLLDAKAEINAALRQPGRPPVYGGIPPQRKRFTLETVVGRELGDAVSKQEQKSNWAAEPLTDAQLAYAAEDARVLVPLAEALEQKLAEDRGLVATFALEMACLPGSVWTATTGLPIDATRQAEQLVRAEAEVTRCKAAWTAETGLTVESGPQVLALFASRGSPLANQQGATLEALRGADRAVALLLAIKQARAPLQSLKSLTPQVDGRVFYSLNQLNSVAGRMSTSEPSVQNIQKNQAVRRLVRAPEGRLLVGGDFSQIELRIAAELSGDPAMLAIFDDPTADLHARTATALFGPEPADLTADQQAARRTRAKAVNFGLSYGQGPDGLVRSAAEWGVELTRAEAAGYLERVAEEFPTFWAWRQRQLDEPGDTRTPSGRLRRILPEQTRTVRVNSPAQGCSADITKRTLASLWATRARCPSARPILLVHDEILIEPPRVL